MKRFFSVLIAVAVFTTPVLSFADDLDDLLNDLDAMETLINELDAEREEDKADRLWSDSEDVFPGDASDRRATDDIRVLATVNGLTITFQDVYQHHWFATYVQQAAEKGVLSGYRDSAGILTGYFGPSDNVTIAQLAKMALESVKHSVSTCTANQPAHVSARGDWSERYIACAETLNWSAYGKAQELVQRPATRAEVVQTLLQAFAVTTASPMGTRFTDVSVQTPYAAAIEQAAKDGIISGYADTQGNRTGTFGPHDPVNRAEVAKMVMLAIGKYAEKD